MTARREGPGGSSTGATTQRRLRVGTERLADGESVVHRTVLPGGLRIITESLPAVRSASFGIWAGVGSRDEDLRHAGATHYLEHLLFKGTKQIGRASCRERAEC